MPIFIAGVVNFSVSKVVNFWIDIYISLHNLYISLREEKSKEKVLARTEELHQIFYMMVQDPTSKEATNKLIQIADETFFKVPD